MIDDLFAFADAHFDVAFQLIKIFLRIDLVKIVPRVRALDHHDEKIAAVVEVLIAHRRFEFVAVFFDPVSAGSIAGFTFVSIRALLSSKPLRATRSTLSSARRALPLAIVPESEFLPFANRGRATFRQTKRRSAREQSRRVHAQFPGGGNDRFTQNFEATELLEREA